MATARRSGDGELIAAGTTAQKRKVTQLQLRCSAAALITIRSGGAAGTILREIGVGTTTISLRNDEDGLCTTAANENLYIAASTGTLKAWCAYTSEN